MALSSVIARNIKSLQSNLKANLSYIDMNIKGPVEDEDFFLTDGSAIVNAYKLWLKSDLGDYCREPSKGGFLRDNLRRYLFSPESEETIKADLISESRKAFPYITVVDCKVTCKLSQKYWLIKLRVQDQLTGLIGDLFSSGLVVPNEE